MRHEDFDEPGAGPAAAGKRRIERREPRRHHADLCSAAPTPDGGMLEKAL
jgi:hypothetical protein